MGVSHRRATDTVGCKPVAYFDTQGAEPFHDVTADSTSSHGNRTLVR